MTSQPTATAGIVIASDTPCVGCGYNLRGLKPEGTCPECGLPVDRSIDTNATPTPGPRWARAVLAGLIVWVIVTAPMIDIVIELWWRWPYMTAPMLNFPGPKYWAVPVLFHYIGTQNMASVMPLLLPLLVPLAVFFITTPLSRRDWNEPAWSVRRLARWGPLFLLGGFFGMVVALYPPESSNQQQLALFGMVTVELPGTILLYLHLSSLAAQMQMKDESAILRVTAWIAAAVILASVVMILAFLPQQPTTRPGIEFAVAFWLIGAISFGTALIAIVTLIRFAGGLWALARPRRAV